MLPAGFRLASVLVSVPANCLAELHSKEGIQAPPGKLLTIAIFGAQLPKAWLFALGLPVGFGTHLIVHSITAIDIVLATAPRLCQTPYIKVRWCATACMAALRHACRLLGLSEAGSCS